MANYEQELLHINRRMIKAIETMAYKGENKENTENTAKLCKWEKHLNTMVEFNFTMTTCGKEVVSLYEYDTAKFKNYVFCPYCGGKICLN